MITARIEKAGATELDAWFKRVLAAPSLDEVIEPTAAPPDKPGQPARARPRGAR